MKLLAFTASFYDKDYDSKLEKLTYTCEALDIDLVTYGHHEFFSFYDSKIVKMGMLLNNFKDKYTHCLYTDTADSLFLTGMDEIITKYLKFNSKLVVSGERNCHPFGHLADKFPQAPTSYRFMNPGNFIGEIEYMLFVINQLKAFRHLQTDDQGHWAEAYLAGRIPELTIDHQCELFQTMSDRELGIDVEILPNGRVRNIETKSYPCIIHFNGPKGEGSHNQKMMNEVFENFRGEYAVI